MARGDAFQNQGQQGGRYLNASGATPADENYRWVVCLTETVLASIENTPGFPPIVDIDTLVGVTLPAGASFGGSFFNIEVTSGNIIAYFK